MNGDKVVVGDVWNALNPLGWYQISSITCIFFGYLQMAYGVLIHVFIGYSPEVQCSNLTKPLREYGFNIDLLNDTTYSIEYGQCHVSILGNGTEGPLEVPCPNGYDFKQLHGSTIVTEWNLLCGSRGLGELSQTFVIVGQIVGAILLSPLPDKYGRKPVIVTAQVLVFALSIAVSFSPTFFVFCILRFLIGVVIQCLNTTAPVMCLELFPTEYRGVAGTISNSMWSTGVLSLTLFGYLFRDFSWRYVQLASGLACFMGIFSFWTLDESLRWLIANNKRKEALDLVKKVARRNKVSSEKPIYLLERNMAGNTIDINRPKQTLQNWEQEAIKEAAVVSDNNDVVTPLTDMVPSKHEIEIATNENSVFSNQDYSENKTVLKPTKQIKGGADNEINANLMEKEECQVKNTSPESISYLDVFRNRKLLRNTVVLSLCWFSANFGYMGIFLVPSPFTSDIYMNYFINALVEFPCLFIIFFIINRIGRKKLILSFFGSAGVAIVIAVTLLLVSKKDGVALIVGALLNYTGKFFISGAVATLYVYTPELYPTNVRNIGYGVTGCAARLGAMTSPFLNVLASAAPWAPGVVFSVTFVLASCSLVALPETKGKELPQTLKDFVSWEKHDKKEKFCLSCTSPN